MNQILIPLSDGRSMSPEDIADELCYASYRHNARLAPHIAPERWAAIYGPQTAAYAERLAAETRKN